MNERLNQMVDDLQRNDAPRAAQVANAIAVDLGAVPGRVMYYLYMLQDDPDDFSQRVEGIPVARDPGAV